MSGGPEVRQQLAEELDGWWVGEVGGDGSRITPQYADEIADALLPVVERIATERAAEALETAARSINLNASSYAETFHHWLMARAEDTRAEAMAAGRQETT